MSQFIIFKNASEGTTAIPLEALSPLELELILQSGGQVVAGHEAPVEALYPRGTAFHYNALAISSSNKPAFITTHD